MREHVNYRTLETRIAHHRHGDQQLAVEVTMIGLIVADAGGFAADIARFLAFRTHPQRPPFSSRILISGSGSVNQAPPAACDNPSQAIQWFEGALGCKDAS